VEDLYSLYVFFFKGRAEDFWYLPLSSALYIIHNKIAIESWEKSEQERRMNKNGKAK